MGRVFGFITLLIAVLIGGYLYIKQLQTVTPGGSAPQTVVDLTGVRNDLMAVANAERQYWATNARYASLDELRASGDIQVHVRLNYTYSADLSDTGFKIIATYSGSDSKAPKRISVDETMMLKTD